MTASSRHNLNNAGIKFTDLPRVTLPATGAEVLCVVQGGISKQATLSDVQGISIIGYMLLATPPGVSNDVTPPSMDSDTRIIDVTTAGGDAVWTGLIAGQDGQQIVITNLGPNILTLDVLSPSSIPANQFRAAADVILVPGVSVNIMYSTDVSEWIVLASASTTTGANPTAQVGLVAVNGLSTNFMRSDAAPPIDQSIAPTWTGQHKFMNATTLFGTLASVAVLGATAAIQQFGVAGPLSGSSMTRGGNDALGVQLALAKTRSVTYNGTAPVQSGDVLGTVSFVGADGTDLSTVAASIFASASGPVSTGIVPGGLNLATAAAGGGAGGRFRVGNFGGWGIGQPASYGTVGQVFTSGGPSAPPTWTSVAGFSAANLANPGTNIGLTVVNGVALTAMRSDGAPALSQAIAPVWTGVHKFTNANTFFGNITALAIGTSMQLQQFGTTTGAAGSSMTKGGVDALGATLAFGKTRSTTYIAAAPVVFDDVIGNLAFYGADGSTINSQAANISVRVGGAVATNIVPGEIRFATGSLAGTLIDRFRISAYGGWGVGVSGDYGIFGQVFASGGPSAAPSWADPTPGPPGPEGDPGPTGPRGDPGPAGADGLGTPANPTGTIGLAAVNGVLTTFIRSDGAPPLSQAIVPTWTGVHTFTAASTRFGPVGMGSAAVGGFSNFVQQFGDNTGTGLSGHSITRGSADTAGPRFVFGKTRALTYTPVGGAVAAGDQLGLLLWCGLDGADLTTIGAQISGHAEGTISAGIIPGNLRFYTGNNAGAITERIRLNAAGALGIAGTNFGTAGQTIISAGSLAAIVWGNPTLVAANFANPSVNLGLTAVNGAAVTAMRSDAAPALDQAIAPTWSGQHTWSLPLRAPDGTGALPSHTFTNDLTSGLSLAGAGNLILSASGVGRARVTAGANVLAINAIGATGNVYIGFYESSLFSTRKGYIGFGNVGDDVMLVAQEKNAGLALQTNAVTRALFDASGSTVTITPQIRGQDGSVGAPAYSFTSDPNTGLYEIAADNFGASAGGVRVMEWIAAASGGAKVADPAGTMENVGYRRVPRSTTATTIAVTDIAKCMAISAAINIPISAFAAGDAVSLYNDSGAPVNITITAGGTLRKSGTATTGTLALAQRGMVTLWFNLGGATPEVIAMGDV